MIHGKNLKKLFMHNDNYISILYSNQQKIQRK
jgi:hypothetical protein